MRWATNSTGNVDWLTSSDVNKHASQGQGQRLRSLLTSLIVRTDQIEHITRRFIDADNQQFINKHPWASTLIRVYAILPKSSLLYKRWLFPYGLHTCPVFHTLHYILVLRFCTFLADVKVTSQKSYLRSSRNYREQETRLVKRRFLLLHPVRGIGCRLYWNSDRFFWKIIVKKT